MHYVHKLCKEEPKMRFLVIFSSTLVDRIDRCDVLGFDVKTLEETDFVMR